MSEIEKIIELRDQMNDAIFNMMDSNISYAILNNMQAIRDNLEEIILMRTAWKKVIRK